MRNLKTLLLTASLLLISLFAFAQDQETITFVSSKKLNGANNVIVNLKGQVETESWDKNYVRIVLEIKSKGLTKEVVRHLASINRFKIASDLSDTNTLVLLNSNMNMPVYINGKEIKEDISYKVYIPQHTTVFITPENEEDSNSLAISNK